MENLTTAGAGAVTLVALVGVATFSGLVKSMTFEAAGFSAGTGCPMACSVAFSGSVGSLSPVPTLSEVPSADDLYPPKDLYLCRIDPWLDRVRGCGSQFEGIGHWRRANGVGRVMLRHLFAVDHLMGRRPTSESCS